MKQRKDSWLNKPIKGTNCWQFICDYYASELGIYLDNYKGELKTREEKEEFARFWKEHLDNNWDEAEEPSYPDLVVFKIGGLVLHAGIVIVGSRMLHMQLAGSTVEDYDSDRWKDRLHGFYTYKKGIIRG